MSQLTTSDPNRLTRNTFTFVAGTTGATGNHTVFTVTGCVFVKKITAYTTTDLVPDVAGATISLGIVANNAGLIDATVAASIDATKLWNRSTSAAADAAHRTDFAYLYDFSLISNIIYNIAVQAIASGVIQFIVEWYPLSTDGNLVATTPA